jgi:hypothetical protein
MKTATFDTELLKIMSQAALAFDLKVFPDYDMRTGHTGVAAPVLVGFRAYSRYDMYLGCFTIRKTHTPELERAQAFLLSCFSPYVGAQAAPQS